MNPHPAIRLVCLVALAATVPWVEWPVVVLVLLFEAAAFVRLGRAALVRSVRAVARMRWLYLALLIGFVGFPPPGLGEGSDAHWAGMGYAAGRIAVLVTMVLAVRLLFETTGNDRLFSGLVRLLTPFRRVGVPVDRFSRRLLMTMQAIDGIRTRAAELRRTEDRGGLSGAVAVAVRLAGDIEAGRTNLQAPGNPRALPGIPAGHWLYPAALLAFLTLTTHLAAIT